MRPKHFEETVATAKMALPMFQANCIVCDEPAAYADDSRKLPEHPICANCKRAILWARKHMEADR